MLGHERMTFRRCHIFPQFLCRKWSRRENVAPRPPNRSEQPSCRIGDCVRHWHPPCIIVGCSNNYPPILDQYKRYPSGVHARLSRVRLHRDLFYAVLFRSGVATPPYGTPNHQKKFTILPEILPSTIPSLSSMSTSPTPSTQDNSLSNAPVDPTSALIALMTQQPHKNASMMAQLQHQPSLPLVAPTHINTTYKIQRPPFNKWDGTPTTKPVFPTQVAT